MKLTEEQVQALVAWAYLDYDPEAIKGSGELFDAAFKVAQEVRDATEVLCACGDFHNEQKCPNCGASEGVPEPKTYSCNCHIPTGSVYDDDGCAICRFVANSGT